MYYSEAYESYTPNGNFDDGLTMRTPVEGTIPRGAIPFSYDKTEDDRLRAGVELVNPLERTPEVVDRGKDVYDIFCLTCHGEKGDGQGYLFSSQRYPYPPASLVSDKVRAVPDGEIYHAISLGYGVMGAHGAMISQADRWKVVHFIRQELQQ
jgi:mono/diheme cytochrome c family protein